jgi:hypothetical protein
MARNRRILHMPMEWMNESCLCTPPRKYEQLGTYIRRGPLQYGVVITAILACTI